MLARRSTRFVHVPSASAALAALVGAALVACGDEPTATLPPDVGDPTPFVQDLDSLLQHRLAVNGFDGRIEAATTLRDGTPAILPSISGRAWITGYHNYVLDPEDPWPQGYTLGDTWYRVLESGEAAEGP